MQYFPDAAHPPFAELQRGLSLLTPAEIERVAIARRIELDSLPARDRPTTIAQIAAMPATITGAIHELDFGALALLRLVWKHGPTLTRAELARVLDGLLDESRSAALLGRLQDLALVLPANAARDAVFVPAAVLGALLGRAQLGSLGIAAVLAGFGAEHVAAIARQLGLPPAPTNNAARLAAINGVFKDADAVRGRILALPRLARDAFDTALARGGYLTIDDLIAGFPALKGGRNVAYYGFGYGVEALYGPQGNPEGLRLLEHEGLLIRYPNQYAYALVVPDEAMAAMALAEPVEARHFVEPPLAPPPAGLQPAGGRPTPILDLVELLQFVEELRPALTQRGTFSKVDAKRLARSLSVREPTYADFVFILAGHCRLVESGERSLESGDQAAAWLEQDELSQLRALLDGWRETPYWRDDVADGYQRDAAEVYRWEPLRTVLLDLLAELPAAGASVASLAARLWYRRPMRVQSPLLEAGEGSPVPPATRLIAGSVRTLAWLGLVEPLTPAGAQEPAGVRLTALGRALLGGAVERSELAPRTDRLIVQPTLDVLAAPTIEPAVYRTLRRFTDPGNASGMRTVTIAPASLRRALDAGMDAAELRGFLEQHAGALPATVAGLLGEVQGRHGRIRVGTATYYLAVDDPLLLAELQADRRLAGMIVRTIAPTIAVARGDSLDQVLTRLRASGHMPVAELPEGTVVPADGAPRRPARKIRGQGAIIDALYEALKYGRTLEMEYQTASAGYGYGARTLHEITVEAMDGDELRVRCRTHISDRRFKLSRVFSVRPV